MKCQLKECNKELTGIGRTKYCCEEHRYIVYRMIAGETLEEYYKRKNAVHKVQKVS